MVPQYLATGCDPLLSIMGQWLAQDRFCLTQLMWRIITILGLLGACQVNAQVRSGSVPPTLIDQKFYTSAPAVAGGTVGTVSAANSPTNWSITGSNSAGEFAISDAGVVTFTSRGAALFDGAAAQKSATLTVQASNAAGVATGSIEIEAYADGAQNAPNGSAQYPTVLETYRARPPWKVAGFDYYVGIPLGTVLSPPQSISNSNITVSGNAVVCSGKGASVSLRAIDFTGYFVYVPSGGCSSLTISDSNFACTGNKSPAFTFFQDQNNASAVIRSSKINSGDNCGAWPDNVSDPIACGGRCTIEYNWFYHASERILSMGEDTLYRWNLINSPDTARGAHENYQQFGGGMTASSDVVEFNASYNALSLGGEGFQFYGNVIPATIVSPVFKYNTMIARKSGGHVTMSFMVHGSCHTARSHCTTISGQGEIADNYFDPSGAYGVFYGGTLTPELGWSVRNNINMLTGNLVVAPH